MSMTPIFLSQNWIIFFPSKQIDFEIMKIIVKLFSIGLLMFCCTDHDLGYKFAAGHVIVGFEPDVTIEQAADFANKYAEGIGHIFGFFYYSNLPNDSLKYVTKIITSSIQLATVRIGFQTNRIEILKNFYDPVDSLTLTK